MKKEDGKNSIFGQAQMGLFDESVAEPLKNENEKKKIYSYTELYHRRDKRIEASVTPDTKCQ